MRTENYPSCYINPPEAHKPHVDYKQFHSERGERFHYEPNEIGFKFSKKREPIQYKKDICVTIVNKDIFIPSDLTDLVQEINDSKYILDLQENWDENGALPISPKVYLKAIVFLTTYAKQIFNIHKTIIQSPEINPCPDGSIDLSWRTDLVRLLINFRIKDDQVTAVFYRDHYNNQNSNKGSLTLDTIDESFFVWMKLLK
jgi:hypothetical protein